MDNFPQVILNHLSDGRLLAGAVGALLVLAGARLYRLAVMAPGFLLGIYATTYVLNELGGRVDTPIRIGMVLGVGLLGAFLTSRIEQLAVRLGGSLLVAAVTHAVLPMVWPHAPGFAAPVVGFLGLFLFPALYQRLLPVITSAIGAIALAWAAGRPQDLLMMAGVTVIGVAIQLATSGKSKKEREK